MVRSPCCQDANLKKRPWTREEDQKPVDYINKHGWTALPKLAGLNRCGKSCGLKWTYYLRPDIKRGKFSDEEESIIIGNKRSRIATYLPLRTDDEIKNYWNCHIKKKLLNMGIDPKTHKDDAAQLAKPQLLQKPLQADAGLSGSQYVYRLVNGRSTLSGKEPTRTQKTQSSGSISQTSSNYQAVDNSWTFFGFSKNLDMNDMSLSYNNIQTENTLPALVSGSPKTSTNNQIKNNNRNHFSTISTDSSACEAWEKLLDG